LTTAGIIANPISGKDIRRLVAHGSVFDNQEKVRIVRRLLMGMEAAGIRQVFYMPDEYHMIPRALRGCRATVETQPAAIRVQGDQTDSTRAAGWMAEQDVGCIVVLGGDGTCRAVAKGTVSIPMLPISTGTNNVFPYMMEATVAGLAAALIASGRVPHSEGIFRSCQLEVLRQDTVTDIALVDAAVYNERFIAARAIWEMEKVSQVFLTRARPDAIGLSAIGGQLHTISPAEPRGLHLRLAPGGRPLLAPIAPGLIAGVSIAEETFMEPGVPVPVTASGCVLALDGEREVEVRQGESVAVRLSTYGPLVVDIGRTMASARDRRLL